jgi:hypothetical protein
MMVKPSQERIVDRQTLTLRRLAIISHFSLKIRLGAGGPTSFRLSPAV